MYTQPPVVFIEQFVPNPDELLALGLAHTEWDDRLRARRTASFGKPYNYSRITYPEIPIPDYLQSIGVAIEQQVGFLPNNCLINNYIEGSSSMGFHADSVTELVAGAGVAIVSLGETRTLTFRRTEAHDVCWGCPLPQGSLLYMPPEMQAEWQHGVLKQPGAGQRISLTFRALKP